MTLARLVFPFAAAWLMVTAPATAQQAAPGQTAQTPAGSVIDFEADQLNYDEKAQIITATGRVSANRDGYTLRADEVIYNRSTGLVEARGNVVLTSPDGQSVTTDRLEISDSLKDGIVENIRLILEDGSRLAARSATKSAKITTLDRAVYSPCTVCNDKGEERPLWQIKAVKVVRDEQRQRIYYKDAYVEFFQTPVLYLPYLSHPDPTVSRATGFLVPQIKTRQSLGVAVEVPYFIALAPWRDLTITPSVFTSELPALAAEYRERLASGPVRVGGYVTYAAIRTTSTVIDPNQQVRGYGYADAQLTHSNGWRSTVRIKLASDDTFLRRYDLSNEDTLRNSYALERQTPNSYFRAELQYFQGLRSSTRQGLVPIVLPALDYGWRSEPSFLGGRFTVAANSTALIRTAGLDSRRASVTAGYEVPFLNALGQQFKFTLQARGDAYNVSDNAKPDEAIYAGRNGTRVRLTPLAAAEARWPLVAKGFGGTQLLEPVVQLVVARRDTRVADYPNEDSRSFDLDETNLFSLNRFPGYDRFEGGARLTYGARYALDRGSLRLETQFGQSFRLNQDSTLFPNGTGLAGKFSDFVGRTSLSLGSRLDIVHRFRVDKSSLAVRRNEVDAIFSGKSWTGSLGYSRLNRNIGIEGLEDREELRLAGRAKITRFWSLVGASIVDLSDAQAVATQSNPVPKTGRFSFIRNSAGIEYEDECLLFGLSWRRNYTQDRDFQRGTTVIFRLVLKTLGGVN